MTAVADRDPRGTTQAAPQPEGNCHVVTEGRNFIAANICSPVGELRAAVRGTNIVISTSGESPNKSKGFLVAEEKGKNTVWARLAFLSFYICKVIGSFIH